MGDFGTEICCCHSLSEERRNEEQKKGSSNRGRHVALKNKSQKNGAPAQNCIWKNPTLSTHNMILTHLKHKYNAYIIVYQAFKYCTTQ